MSISDKVVEPTTLIIFGATGDLARRKLINSLLNLYDKNYLPGKFQIIGISRRDYTDQQFRKFLREESIKNLSYDIKSGTINNFLKKIYYQKGFFEDISTYEDIKNFLLKNQDSTGICSNKLYYLAVPPKFYQKIFINLYSSGLTDTCSGKGGWTRVLVEKPFGRDIKTARKLDNMLGKLFKEEQIFRIDHYLAKDTVQNIIYFRFSNIFFEPIWSNKFIEKIEIKLLEQLDVGQRGMFYDDLGALRDVGQNHILQMLALVTMDNPVAMNPYSIRKEKAKVLKKLVPINNEELAGKYTIRAQYKGYDENMGTKIGSDTETYFKIMTHINNKRWSGVPFYLESGKGLKFKNTEIIIYFKDAETCVCPGNRLKNTHRNILNIKIYPEEGIFLRFWSRKHGLLNELESRDFIFYYHRGDEEETGEYDKILLDCLKGDQTLFASTKEVNLAWDYITPILDNWKNTVLHAYKKGSSGPVKTF